MSTETANKPYRLAAGEGLADVWWKTGRITVKAGPDETSNAFSQFEVDDPHGSGPTGPGSPLSPPRAQPRSVLRGLGGVVAEALGEQCEGAFAEPAHIGGESLGLVVVEDAPAHVVDQSALDAHHRVGRYSRSYV